MLRIPAPRVLPLTIAAMAVLLGAKAIDVARAAAAGASPQAVAGAVVPPAQAQRLPTRPVGAAAPAPGGAAPVAPAPAPVAATPAQIANSPAPIRPAASTAAVTTPAAITPAAAPPPVSLTPAIPPPPLASPAEQALLGDLRARRRALDARAQALDAREAVLSAAERTLDARVKQLATLQASLEALEARRKQREDANWVGLVKVYEAMPPRGAATIFDSLDMKVLLPILDRMAERKAAPILAAMQPDRARAATDALARLRTRETQLGKS